MYSVIISLILVTGYYLFVCQKVVTNCFSIAPITQACAVEEVVQIINVPINSTFVCPYRQICKRFLRSLSFSGNNSEHVFLVLVY